MSARIIPFNYEGQAVAFNADGWINATQAAAQFGKRPNDWLSLPSTTDYLAALSRRTVTGLSGNDLVSVKQGGKNQGTWLHPKLAVKFARWLSVDFEIWCDEQIDQLVRGGPSAWQQARKQSSIGYRGMCEALALTHEADGKAIKPYHFMNEARLINEVVTGVFAGRNRDQLSESELTLVGLLEVRDVLLLGQGRSYQSRKQSLLRYMSKLQTKHQRRVA